MNNRNEIIGKVILRILTLGLIAFTIYWIAIFLLYTLLIACLCLLIGIAGYFLFQFIRYKMPPKEVYKSQRYLRLFLFGPKGLNQEEKQWLKEKLSSGDDIRLNETLELPRLENQEIAIQSDVG